MVINTNTSALSSARLLSQSSNMLAGSLARLSSGSKIVSPSDDAAGLAVSMRFESQINRISAANTNVANAISFSQTQDGYLAQVGTALDRMSQLAMLAQDPTKTTTDLTNYNAEFQKLSTYIGDLATKQFNGVALFNTTGLQVTTDSEGTNKLTLSPIDLSASTDVGLATAASVDLTSAANAGTALGLIKTAIDTLAGARANVGANISVLNSYSSQLGVLSDNMTSANSRIKDVDVAQESTTYAKYNILVQAGTAMLAQANSTPQAALKLLQ